MLSAHAHNLAQYEDKDRQQTAGGMHGVRAVSYQRCNAQGTIGLVCYALFLVMQFSKITQLTRAL